MSHHHTHVTSSVPLTVGIAPHYTAQYTEVNTHTHRQTHTHTHTTESEPKQATPPPLIGQINKLPGGRKRSEGY